MTKAERREMVWAHEKLLELYGSDRKLAKATAAYGDDGWEHSSLSRITLESGGSLEVLERFRQMLARHGVIEQAEVLTSGVRRLRDLPKFADALGEAKRVGPPHPVEVWEQVGDQIAGKDQLEATPLNCIMAAQFIASGLPSTIPPTSTKRQR